MAAGVDERRRCDQAGAGVATGAGFARFRGRRWTDTAMPAMAAHVLR